MNRKLSEEQLDGLLLAIERREMRSLRWGATQAALFEDELIDLATGIMDSDPEEAAGELLDRRLLFRVPAPGGGIRYRSRFAEGVRLMASLRQLFPGRRWEAAPSLVADYRADLRERRFPRRDQPAAAVIERLAAKLGWTPEDGAIARALLRGLTLAAFQERAAEAMLRTVSADRGVVIAAGTGAGKTLAYYLPVIVRIAREVRAGDHWTKAVSVYPRNELLKDQFAEVLRYVHLVGEVRGRPLTIGTFFGPTPNDATVESVQRKWQAFPPQGRTVGFLCPFATCPECEGRLVWRRADITAKRERLTCEHALGDAEECAFTTDPAQVLLTRRAMRRPPDLLFTTAEMLNQRLSDPAARSALGLGQPRQRRPLFMLLDEAHTYEGVAGAQAAMVFRRWRHGVGAPVRWAGLSATLRGGPAFFSQLTGVTESAVEEVTPNEDEYETAAAEYQVILRGDPLSQTALLSTSIQSSFLLARLLDPETAPSHGRAGHRVFVFTDDLDVTNRLFHDLRDAERQRLARERSRERAGGEQAFAAGQQWRTLEEIGWDLGVPLDVSRTSSQDAGVSATSQLVVATASLEVGFDDNRVGAVVQHKSPHRASSFVQRKGRAGRTREMRPWMVTVLSDYGRDRITYESYDRLFDPIVEPQRLPIANGYVRRMHAGFAFIDWLAASSKSRPWWWWALDGPSSYRGTADQQQALEELIERLLDGNEAELVSLRRHLREALRLGDDDVDAVLWQPPRSLMLEVLPTLARRLATRWETANPHGAAGALDAVSDSPYPLPLPEFLPPNLFSDLNLPEVGVRGLGIDADASLLIEQALRLLPPGRVTRRFAPTHPDRYHWVPVPTDSAERCELPLSEFIPRAFPVAEVTIEVDGLPREVTVYRPWEIELAVVPTPKGVSGGGDVLPSSNATYRWHTQIMPRGEPLGIEAAHDPVWSQFVDRIEFYLHDQRSPLTVRRFAAEADANLQLRRRRGSDGGRDERTLRVLLRDPVDPSRPAAIGYEAEVDGVVVRFREVDREVITSRADEAPSLSAWRTAYVRSLVASDPELPTQAHSFLRGWLFDLYLATLLETALTFDIHASAANDLLRSEGHIERFERVLSGFLHVERQIEHPEEGGATNTDDGDGSDGATTTRDRRMRGRLLALAGDEAVRGRLADLFAECWSPSPAGWTRWLDSALHATLSEAARAAALSTAPDHVTEDAVRLDLGRAGSADSDQPREAWITESAIGGSGIVEAIASAYAAEPRAFFRSLEVEFLPSEFELSSVDLDAAVAFGTEDADVRRALGGARDAESHVDRDRRMSELVGILQSRGITPGHAYLAALNQRLLRPGMPDDAYRVIHELVTFWRTVEGDHGIAIDLRVFCSLAVHAAHLGPRLSADELQQFLAEQGGANLSSADRAGVLLGLLWPRGHEVRRRALQSWSPFRGIEFTDPALVRELLLRDGVPEVLLSNPNWHAEFSATISRTGIARLRATVDDAAGLQSTLFRLLAEPLDVGFLQLYPGVEQLRREGRHYVATIVLRGIV